MKRKHLFVMLAVLVLIVVTACVFTACNKNNVKSLYKPTNITYDGTRISWTRVDLAEHYTVSIDGGEAKRVNTNMFTFTSQGGEFEVTVSSVVGGKTFSESKRFIQLETISDFIVSDDGMLSWNEIAGATAYRVSVNGQVLAQDVAETHYKAGAGNSRIKVRAVVSSDDSYYSFWSNEKQITVYSTPSNINYDGEKVTWLGNAPKYEVNINGVKQIATGGQLMYNSQNRDFSVEIKAVGDHEYTYDSDLTTEAFHYLQPATDLQVEDGILYWNPVADAEGYEIRINGVLQSEKLKTPTYDKLASDTQFRVEIRPYNNSGKYFSTWSAEKNIYILKTPTVRWNADLELDGAANNNFIWDLVNGAAGYVVSLEKNGVEVQSPTLASTITAYANAYAEVGVYKVRVKAVASSATADYCDSKFSEAIIVERLAAPTFVSISSDAANLAEGFTVNYLGVSGASGYQLYKDGTILDGKFTTVLEISDKNVADSTVTTEQNYTYTVRSMGAVKNVNGTTYATLPCLSANALSFNITVQAMPLNLDMSGFNATWTAVNGANGYAVSYGGNPFTANQTTYNLETLEAGTYSVTVCTKGNGTTTLPSNYTAPISVTRLVAPTNIRIMYGAGEGQLEFNGVANAKGYEVYYDENRDPIKEDAWDNMYQFIKETGTTLSMVSSANEWNEGRTVYYMSSQPSPTQQFIRLAKPTFADAPFANSVEFVWNAPANINTQEYTPTYEVYESNQMQTGGVMNGTRYSVEYLDGGKAYEFRVKAKGNNTKYLDSEMSVVVPIYKLATPQLTITNNEYQWTGVVNASGYALEIDGVRVSNDLHVSGNTYSYKPNYTSNGNHIVKLYATGDSGYHNINSKAYTYNQVVSQCLAPEISYKYTTEQVTTGGAIEVKVTLPSQNCTKYQYEIAGETIVSDQLVVSKAMESTGTFSIRVKALGGAFDSNEVYYMDSQYAGGGTGDTITLLAAPTYNSFVFTSDGVFMWATITGADGYDYQISFDGEDFGDVGHVSRGVLDPISNFSDYKTITIRLRSHGNGQDVITSTWVEYTWTNPHK